MKSLGGWMTLKGTTQHWPKRLLLELHTKEDQ